MRKFIIAFLLSIFLFSCSENIEKKEEIFIKNIDFFTQAPLETKTNWKIHDESCEEASVLLYTSFLEGKKFNKNSFNTELIKMKKFQTKNNKKEKDIKKYDLKDFINSYYKKLQAKVVLNLNETKITWLLEEQKPILIGIDASDIDNPYYHYARYHTLLIIGETQKDFIIKDVGTKKGNDWKYPKKEIIKALNKVGNWGIIIEKIKKDTINTDSIKNEKSFNYSTFQSKSFYNNLILDKHSGNSINLPKNIGAGIIAHHLTVGPYFDDYFRNLKKTRPNIKTFILGGTNHFNFDNAIYSTSLDYKTPFGILKIDRYLQEEIKGFKINNSLISNEHSIHSITGFIKKYYPKAKIFPFIISENVDKKSLDEFGKNIFKNFDTKNYFYLQSTDFSHYQPQYLTNFYDLYSKNILDDFDKKRISNMNVDSRNLQYLTFSILEKLGLKKHFNLINSSSNKFLKVENFQNTSHFFSYFGKGDSNTFSFGQKGEMPKGQRGIKSNQLSILFTGDLILNYDIPKKEKLAENGRVSNRAYPFDKIDSFEEMFFRGFDEIIINLEGNIANKTFEEDIKGGPIHFKFDDDWLKMIKNVMKAKVIFFSNNHIRDFGERAIVKTKDFVEKNGLKFVGTGTGFFPKKNVYKRTIGEKELIVINVNDVVTPLFDYDLKLIKKYISENKKKNSVVVVYIHWGREYELKANKRQKELGHKFIDFGADLIVGNHTHTIQNKEIYKGKYIYYSLGNLSYDSIRQKAYIPEVKLGLFLGVNFHNNKVDFFEIPYKIEERRPILLIGKEKERVLKSLE